MSTVPGRTPPGQSGSRRNLLIAGVVAAAVVVALVVGSLLFRGGDSDDSEATPTAPGEVSRYSTESRRIERSWGRPTRA
jgi:hypothetical protein